MTDLAAAVQAELDSVGIDARPVVMPTSWNVGPVLAYLFPQSPVTLIDAGLPSGRPHVEEALQLAGLETPDVKRIVVTHSHGDHIGGAQWLQQESGCEVLLHRSEVELLVDPHRLEAMRELFVPLGFDPAQLERYMRRPSALPTRFLPVDGGEDLTIGGRILRVEHHAGHTPGHLWIEDVASGAIFAGDYLLASSPTNPGMMLDPNSPTGRVPMLQRYLDGLRELARRNPPVLFGGHGVPVTNVPALVERRLSRSERRTRRIRDVLAGAGDATPVQLADHLYRGRARESWDVMAELVGHLDLLVTQGRATTHLGQDGSWHFAATKGGSDA